MPLADKIIELRKKQGWSQIDLADRLDVSRQSVSKWEMAQAVPELDKIIKMSELFAVTTDYLLKDEAPRPDSTGGALPPPPEEPPQPAPEPEKDTPPARKRRKKRPWVLAAALALALAVALLLWAAGAGRPEPEQLVQPPFPYAPSPTPAPDLTEQTVVEEPAGSPQEQTAVSDPDGPDAGMTEYAYEGSAVTAGGIDPEALQAAIAEYAPYGVTCEYDESHCQWYLDGQPIRVLTDVLSSNGESLTSGDFQGVIRNFAGDGDIDVRTVRDYAHCDEQGHGTLLYLESCDARLDSPRWVEHHAAEPHEEEHHEEIHHTAAGASAPAARLAEAAVQTDGKTVLRYTLAYESSGDTLPSQMRMHALDGSAPDTLTYYEYDDAGRVVSRRYELEGQDTSVEFWTYDEAGRLAQYVETVYIFSDGPDAWATTYEYDGEGRLTAARESHNGTDAYVTEYEYSPAPELGGGTLPSARVRYDMADGGAAVEEIRCTYQNDLLATEEHFTDGVLRRSIEYTYPMGYGCFTVRAEEQTYDESGPTGDRTVRLIRRDGAGQDVLTFTLPGTEDLAYDETGCLLRAAGGDRAIEFTYE